MKEKLIPEKMKKPAGLFSWGIKAGNFVFISGIVGIDIAGKIVGKGDAKIQAKQAFVNIAAILETAGVEPKNIIKLVTYLRNISDYPKVGEARAEFFRENSITEDDFPASTAVEAKLINADFLVEIEAVAYIG